MSATPSFATPTSPATGVPTHTDRASDVLGATRHPLDTFFRPRSVAVIGATEKAGSVGRTILWNLISSPFGGTVFPVNPSAPERAGHQGHPNLAAIPEQVDLAVIVTPPPTVPGLIGRVRRGWRPGRDHHLGRLPGGRSRRVPSWSDSVVAQARPRPHARRGPQLPGRHEPA